jgi:hypothetical protein
MAFSISIVVFVLFVIFLVSCGRDPHEPPFKIPPLPKAEPAPQPDAAKPTDKKSKK